MIVKIPVNLPYRIHADDAPPMNTPRAISAILMRTALVAKHKEVKVRALQRTIKRILDAIAAASEKDSKVEHIEISLDDARELQVAMEEFPCPPLMTSWFVLLADTFDDVMRAAKDAPATSAK